MIKLSVLLCLFCGKACIGFASPPVKTINVKSSWENKQPILATNYFSDIEYVTLETSRLQKLKNLEETDNPVIVIAKTKD